MLKGSIYDWVVSVNNVLKLEPTVQNKAVKVEENTKLRNENVNVDGHNKWKNQQRKWTHDLVNWLIGDDGERWGVEKHVMMFMNNPTFAEVMTTPMVDELPEIR